MQQDAHEFLNYLLNTIADLLQEERKQDKQNGKLANGTLDSQNNNSTPPSSTWVHEIFQGTLTNETRCLTCETVIAHHVNTLVQYDGILIVLPAVIGCAIIWGVSLDFVLSQISSKDEDFLDLSVDVEQNTSITHCLRSESILALKPSLNINMCLF